MSKHDISENDLAIFPPYMSLFLLVTLCMMVSHGLAATTVFFFYINIDPALAFFLSMGSSLVFVTFNFMLIRGYLWSLKGLESLAGLYSLIALSAVFEIGHVPTDYKLSLAILVPSLTAWFTIRSTRYHVMANFIAKRWRFYRETGRTVIEELERQRRSNANRSARLRNNR